MIHIPALMILFFIDTFVQDPYTTCLEVYAALIDRGLIDIKWFHDPEDYMIYLCERDHRMTPRIQLAGLIDWGYDRFSDLLPLPTDLLPDLKND